MKKQKTISMEIEPGFDFVIEEGKNKSTNVRRISWNGKDPKIDIRGWLYKDSEEIPMKGVCLSDEGTDELVGVLIENGYGDTQRIKKALKKRRDYNTEEEVEIDNEEEFYYDPKELLGG